MNSNRMLGPFFGIFASALVIMIILLISVAAQRDDYRKQTRNLSMAYKSHLTGEYIRDTCKIEVAEGRPRLVNPQDEFCIASMQVRAEKEIGAIAKE